MNRKIFFVLAAVFLAVALIAPPILLFLQADNDLDNYIVVQNPTGLQTNGNITIVTPEEIQENHAKTFVIVALVEVVFVVLFVVTMYLGINYIKPQEQIENADAGVLVQSQIFKSY